VVEIDTDEEGEPITSCVVIAEERTGEAIRRALPPKSGNQRIIWDAPGDAFRSAGSIAPEGAPKDLPPGRPCLSLEYAIAATRGRLVCDSKRQTERTQSAITGLINRGLLTYREGWLWSA
jgi:putative DNA primase/helicase